MASRVNPETEQAVVLVKAMPHVGKRHGEAVCCAGVTREHKWRRQFPVCFRALDEEKKFARWQWIEYDYLTPKDDRRPESRRLIENSIRILGELKRSERADFLRPIVRASTEEAASRGETLTLVEPRDVRFEWEQKSDKEMHEEAAQFRDWAAQLSFLRDPLNPIDPCPYKFVFRYKDEKGRERRSTCDDWETAATFRNRRRADGEVKALESMAKTFGEEYPARGMVFAMGTHSQFPDRWLLVGVLRLDRSSQGDLFA